MKRLNLRNELHFSDRTPVFLESGRILVCKPGLLYEKFKTDALLSEKYPNLYDNRIKLEYSYWLNIKETTDTDSDLHQLSKIMLNHPIFIDYKRKKIL